MAASIPVMILTALYAYGRAIWLGCLTIAYLTGRQLLTPNKCLWKVRQRESPPKCLQDKELGQHGYVSVKGMKFHYVEKGDRSKPLMLFVHGFPEFWFSWRHQMKEFSKDYWTVAIDMRGYGDSVKPPNVSDYNVELLVDDIKGIVTELGKKSFVLVAHDWGAIISWTFVDKYPDMVDKYIMMNGPHPKIFGIMMKFKEQAKKSWYTFLFQLPFLPEIWISWDDFASFKTMFLGEKKSNPCVTEDDIEAFKYTFSQPGACTPPINYYRAALRKRIFQGYNVKPQSSKGQRPRPAGLYIFGAKDIAIDIRNVEMHKEFFEPVDTVIIPQGNHFIQQDEPKAVNDAIRAFLNKK